MRAILRNEHTYSENEETDIQMKINAIMQTLDQEMQNPTKKSPISYIDLAGKQVEKLLATARLKKKERLHLQAPT